ncbi:facilitated trehalose transporter Tret1-like [Diorhabda sublineata]|uniref:facilitated trehalose transporter Tret1-like n=1 Tax=Diorhabda sublineata TaxID=1163346 RepID=UPI0024E081E9|nr:facilitated trehalose transporter Tret1-like [Diorhabda sublineata]
MVGDRKKIATILTACVLLILASASAIWIVFGIKKLERIMFLKVHHVNILNAMLPVGGVAGTIIFGTAAELTGRKITLLAIAATYAIAFIVFQFVKSLTVACIGRVIAGFAVGGSYIVLPIYIGEMSEPSSRGTMGCMMTISSLIGYLVCYLIANYCTYTIYNVVAIALSLVFILTFIWIGVESPYYFLRRQQDEDQTDITHFENGNNIHRLLYFREQKFMTCCRSAVWIKSLMMMSLLILIHHFSGVSMIPILLQYVASYLGSRNFSLDQKIILIISVGLELVGTIVCTLLVDKLGRKPCLIISTVCIALFYAPMAILNAIRTKYLDVNQVPALTILFLVMFLIFFNCGIAPIPRILLGEIFPMKIKMFAAAYIVSLQQISVFIVTNYFQQISYFIGYNTILFIFFGSMTLAPILIHFGIFETKGKSLHEIQMVLKNY